MNSGIKGSAMAWPGHEGCGQRRTKGFAGQGVVAFRPAVGAMVRQAPRAAQLLGAEVLRAVEGDQHAPAKPRERRQAAPAVQRVEHLVEDGLQVRGMHGVEHRTDVVVGRDRGHAEQGPAVRRRAPLLQAALVGQEGLRLHEEQREGRHPDVGHAVAHVAAPRVREGRARRAHASNKGVQKLHPERGLYRTAQQNP